MPNTKMPQLPNKGARKVPRTKQNPASKKPASKGLTVLAKATPPQLQDSFGEVLQLIQSARQRAFRAVNTELVTLYWQVGEYISRKLESAEWGDKIVDALARFLAKTQSGLRGFTSRNLFRMRQFYDCYRDHAIVSPLVTQLPWTHHLLILSHSKREEEREFYIRLAIHERWGKRELERQLRSARFERTILSPVKVSPVVRQLHPEALDIFKDAYTLEFLGLAQDHSEADLHGALLQHLGRFITELGKDFCFLGSKYPLQVGGQDFWIDLLFFHRGLNCLVALELKASRFEPAHLGQLNFYLEALDRQHRKPHENPAIGLLLCATKDEEVVEYALSRSLSPATIAEYKTHLPDKRLLRAKLHEFYNLLHTEPEPPTRPARRPKRPKRAVKKTPALSFKLHMSVPARNENRATELVCDARTVSQRSPETRPKNSQPKANLPRSPIRFRLQHGPGNPNFRSPETASQVARPLLSNSSSKLAHTYEFPRCRR